MIALSDVFSVPVVELLNRKCTNTTQSHKGQAKLWRKMIYEFFAVIVNELTVTFFFFMYILKTVMKTKVLKLTGHTPTGNTIKFIKFCVGKRNGRSSPAPNHSSSRVANIQSGLWLCYHFLADSPLCNLSQCASLAKTFQGSRRRWRVLLLELRTRGYYSTLASVPAIKQWHSAFLELAWLWRSPKSITEMTGNLLRSRNSMTHTCQRHPLALGCWSEGGRLSLVIDTPAPPCCMAIARWKIHVDSQAKCRDLPTGTVWDRLR